ncbi:hypothetical protein BJ912DRAFT_1140675 [Pholiota molesta]|nr:hypothetical protein BJ912DRAFT_1140675 [Pholiota molesta]
MSASTSASTSFASASIEAPPQSLTHTTWSAPETRLIDPMDASFGYTLSLSSSRTHESRHDGSRRLSLSGDVPPPYDEEAAIPLPGYTLHAPEPLTLAMYLFKFGFLFPPFWIFGAFILLSPLREPTTEDVVTPAWMPEKTEEERQAIIATLREVEVKWARRCVCALAIFTLLAVGGALAAWGILRR